MTRLQPKFVELCSKYMDRHNDMTQQDFSKITGIDYVTISRLLNTDDQTGKYIRKLSSGYILRCINEGVFSMEDIFDGQSQTKKEAEFWEELRIEGESLKLVHQLIKQGVDITSVLKAMVKKD